MAFILGTLVIPSSTNQERIAQNFAAANILLSEEDMVAVRQLDEGRRIVDGPWCPKWDV